MILTIPLQAGTALANVRYKWIALGIEGDELSTGIIQPDITLPVFRFDITPPADAEELIVYDVVDPTNNWNVAQFKIAAIAQAIFPPSGSPGSGGGTWQILNSEDVLSEFTISEASALRTLQGSGSGSGQPFLNIDAIVGRVINEVRGYINAGNYALDVISNTIPSSLFEDAIAIARWRLLISTPSLRQLQTEERKQAFEDALKKLTLIAQSNFDIDDVNPDAIPKTGMWDSENKLIMRTHPIPRPATQFTPQVNTYANPNAPADTTNDT